MLGGGGRREVSGTAICQLWWDGGGLEGGAYCSSWPVGGPGGGAYWFSSFGDLPAGIS